MNIKISLIIFSLLSLSALTSCQPQQTSTTDIPAPDHIEIKVASFNIRTAHADDGPNNWNFRKDIVSEYLKTSNPDIIGLQEAVRLQLDYIRQKFPQYAETGRPRDDGISKGEYNSILYNSERFTLIDARTFWFSDTPDVPGSSNWANAWIRICSWALLKENSSQINFYIYNLHLDNKSQLSREKSIILLTSRIKNRPANHPFIITGDFNATRDNSIIKYLTNKKTYFSLPKDKIDSLILIDTFNAVHPDAKNLATFNADFKGVRIGRRIDYIFTQKNFQILDAGIEYTNIDNRYPSDHFPIYAILKLAKYNN